MAIPSKSEAAKKISEFLNGIITHGGFRLKYRITVDPPPSNEFDRPEILVDLAGPDSALVLERGGELLRAFEQLSLEMLRSGQDEQDKVVFDCRNHRANRMAELSMSAEVAAENVRKSKAPYRFAPMSSRERRLLHLALKPAEDLRTESDGEGRERCVVLYPKDYKAASPTRNRRFQMLN